MLKKGVEYPVDGFFAKQEAQGLALSFDEALIIPGYTEVLPAHVDVAGRFSRNVMLHKPIVSSPMDTVTEHKMAIAMALNGGLGIIHRGLTPAEQATQVAKVKFYLNGLIKKPITVSPEDTMESILSRAEDKEFKFRSFPVVDGDGKLIGLISGNDFDFCLDLKQTVRKVMSRSLIKAPEGTSIEEVFEMMQKHKKKTIPLVDAEGGLTGMYVHSDVRRIITGGSPSYNLDANDNLVVGAAIGVYDDAYARAELLVKKGVDVMVIDTSHGASLSVIETIKELKKLYPGVDIVAGNISNAKAAIMLAEAGADGVRVGIGPGSICTTRVVTGVGEPQLTAVYNCAKALRGTDVPACADGGIKTSGHIALALAVGASSVMLGSMLAGTEETPGDVLHVEGRKVKVYRGMGSIGAMQDSRAARDRYMQGDQKIDKLVPEGVEGVVPVKDSVAGVLFQCEGGLRSSMAHLGARNLAEFQESVDLNRITTAGLRESHPHSIMITKRAPNYTEL